MITFSLLPPLLIDLTLRLSIWRRHPPTAPYFLCRVVQMLEFPAFLLPTKLRQLMHSPSALTEDSSPNIGGTFLHIPVCNVILTRAVDVDPCENGIEKYVISVQRKEWTTLKF